jgi:late competence protein required for DNA uptake (superfamily II DNA/RNA helicase)
MISTILRSNNKYNKDIPCFLVYEPKNLQYGRIKLEVCVRKILLRRAFNKIKQLEWCICESEACDNISEGLLEKIKKKVYNFVYYLRQ